MTEQDVKDRRIANRQRVLRGAKIVYGNYMFLLDARIRDISATGARLKLTEATPVPPTFHLFMSDSQTICAAHLVWRNGQEIGIEFDEQPRSVLDSSDPRLKRFTFMT
jgi:hypothetical protein